VEAAPTKPMVLASSRVFPKEEAICGAEEILAQGTPK